MLSIAPFEPSHVTEAAALAAAHVGALCEQVPLIPERWTAPEAYLERLADLADRNPAAVAVDDGRVVGYLAAMRLDWALGRWAFSPEWANVCSGPHARLARENLYAELAGQWVDEDRRAHFVSLLPNDTTALETMAWLGFGVTNVDGLRGVEPLSSEGAAAVDVVRAGPSDQQAVNVLEQGLRDHLAATPLFLHFPPPDPGNLEAILADPHTATLLATDVRGPLAFLRIGPASSDASTIIRDEKTASITRAFTRPDRRGEGVAAALLDAALAWARDAGYRRSAVDFESANLLARRFWPRHFEIVGLTVGRRL